MLREPKIKLDLREPKNKIEKTKHLEVFVNVKNKSRGRGTALAKRRWFILTIERNKCFDIAKTTLKLIKRKKIRLESPKIKKEDETLGGS